MLMAVAGEPSDSGMIIGSLEMLQEKYNMVSPDYHVTLFQGS